MAEYDVAVVGGGPGGYSAAIRAAQLGGRAILFEQGPLGGTCLNVGCIPTKYLLEKAALLDSIAKETASGILRDAGLYSWRKIQSGKDDVVKRLVTGLERVVGSQGIAVVRCHARVGKPGVVQTDNSETYQARNIIIATGSRPAMPPIPGVNSNYVLDSSAALALHKVPRRLVIIGGGVIGLELASVYRAMGSDVVLLEMLPSLLNNEDRELATGLTQGVGRHGIRVFTGAEVQEITDGQGCCSVRYRHEGTMNELSADHVLVATGRKPNIQGIDYRTLGLRLDDRGCIMVNKRQETSVAGIFAVGDVTGGYQLAHTAYAQAETAAANCMGGNKETNLTVVPRCVYSLPQAAAVGLTEEEVIERHIPYDRGIVSYAANGKALASGEQYGFVKVLCEKESGKVLGVHILGGHATELVASAFTAMNLNATIDDLGAMIFPHPTLSELVKEAAHSIRNTSVHTLKAAQTR